MDLLYINEHLNCRNYDKREKPEIEVVKIVKGETRELSIVTNEIVFFMEGRSKFIFENFPRYEAMKGECLFLPAGGKYTIEVITNTMLVVFRLHKPLMLCENFHIEKLYDGKQEAGDYQSRTKRSFSVLYINPRLWHFLDGVHDCIADGIKCRCYFEMKIKELLLLLRAYYPKEALHDFFFLILSGDTAFSEYVRLRWQRFASIGEMAQSMHLTHKQFYSRFMAVFGKTPQQWIMEGKAGIIFNEIISSKKQFKQIALENGFSSDAQFTRFCKRMLGRTPTQIRENEPTKG